MARVLSDRSKPSPCYVASLLFLCCIHSHTHHQGIRRIIRTLSSSCMAVRVHTRVPRKITFRIMYGKWCHFVSPLFLSRKLLANVAIVTLLPRVTTTDSLSRWSVAVNSRNKRCHISYQSTKETSTELTVIVVVVSHLKPRIKQHPVPGDIFAWAIVVKHDLSLVSPRTIEINESSRFSRWHSLRLIFESERVRRERACNWNAVGREKQMEISTRDDYCRWKTSITMGNDRFPRCEKWKATSLALVKSNKKRGGKKNHRNSRRYRSSLCGSTCIWSTPDNE